MFDIQIHAARRAAVQAAMRREGGGAMLLPAAEEKIRNNDSEYLFRQDSDFAYATGFDEPTGCALLFADGRYALFVRPKDPEREIWTGRRAGVEGARRSPRGATAPTAGEVEARLAELLDPAPGHCGSASARSGTWDGRVSRALCDAQGPGAHGRHGAAAVSIPGSSCTRCGSSRPPRSSRRLRKAAEITAEAHVAAMRDGQPGRGASSRWRR